MKLKSAFLQLNCQFDKQALEHEVLKLPEDAWRPHPQGFKGNSAVALIARDGQSDNDLTHGPMLATKWLDNLPYIRDVLASFKAPLGRTRLMRIQGHGQVPKHTDLDYYWFQRMRIHIPIMTNEDVQFECGDATVNMATGEAWVFDTTQLHRVTNPRGGDRIHLVIDTVGSHFLFDLMADRESESQLHLTANLPNNNIEQLHFEHHNRPTVMSPHEQKIILTEFIDLLAQEAQHPLIAKIETALNPILQDWQAAWAIHGLSPAGLSQFESLKNQLKVVIDGLDSQQTFRGSAVSEWLQHWLLEPALNVKNKEDLQDYKQSNRSQKNVTAESSFDSQYTESLPALIEHLGGSLAVTTYASNRLVLLRANGTELNTHFKDFTGPMGLAFDGQKVALGVQNSIWLFRSQADLCPVFQPNCDAVFNPTKQHMTGDIRIHELAWSGDTLWMVNTRFSCLATLDDKHSFVPQWHPHFIKNLTAEDACHLNGMAVRDNKPAWVSALGVSDEPGGWRTNKLNGGVLIDVASGEIATSGLCMPHSPRWHGDSLWVLDSGRGGLCQVDAVTGQRQLVTQLPGFTRGLAMVDRYAFVGCSRIREVSWFGGLPIQAGKQPLECGIWAVDLVTAQVVGWLKFDQGIDEIFDVQWLPGLKHPNILEPNEAAARNGFTLPADPITPFQLTQSI